MTESHVFAVDILFALCACALTIRYHKAWKLNPDYSITRATILKQTVLLASAVKECKVNYDTPPMAFLASKKVFSQYHFGNGWMEAEVVYCSSIK